LQIDIAYVLLKKTTFWKRAKKSPTFWDADLVRKSRAFDTFEMGEKES